MIETLPQAIREDIEVVGEIRYWIDHFGYKYRLDGGPKRPEFRRRVTTCLKGIPKEWMSRWKLKMAAQRVLDAMAAGEEIPTSHTDLVNWLDAASDEYRDERADRGSAIHAAIEATVNGEEIPPGLSEEEAACAAHVETLLDARNRTLIERPLGSEITVFSETHEYAGTFDLWDEEDGALILDDWKSGKGLYVEAALQLTMYRNAEFAAIGKVPVPGKSDAWTATLIRWKPEYASRLWLHHVTPEGITSKEVNPGLATYCWHTARASMWIYDWLRNTDDFKKTPKIEVLIERDRLAENLEASLAQGAA